MTAPKRTNSARSLYLGRGGQLAVMAEFLCRGYNTATPEVDRGDDIFVVRDQGGDLYRIQVKTASAKKKKSGEWRANFKVGLAQLATPKRPDLFYIFILRLGVQWSDFIVIARAELYQLVADGLGGDVDHGQSRLFKLTYSPSEVECGNTSLSIYRNDWTRWPALTNPLRWESLAEPGTCGKATRWNSRSKTDA